MFKAFNPFKYSNNISHIFKNNNILIPSQNQWNQADSFTKQQFYNNFISSSKLNSTTISHNDFNSLISYLYTGNNCIPQFTDLCVVLDTLYDYKQITDFGYQFIDEKPIKVTYCELDNNIEYQWLIQYISKQDNQEKIISHISDNKLESFEYILNEYCSLESPLTSNIEYYYEKSNYGEYFSILPSNDINSFILLSKIIQLTPFESNLLKAELHPLLRCNYIQPNYFTSLYNRPCLVFSDNINSVKVLDLLTKYSTPWISEYTLNESLETVLNLYEQQLYNLNSQSPQLLSLENGYNIFIEYDKKVIRDKNITVIVPKNYNTDVILYDITNYFHSYKYNEQHVIIFCSTYGYNSIKATIFSLNGEYIDTIPLNYQIENNNKIEIDNNNNNNNNQQNIYNHKITNISNMNIKEERYINEYNKNEDLEVIDENMNEYNDNELDNNENIIENDKDITMNKFSTLDYLEQAICVTAYLLNAPEWFGKASKHREWKFNEHLKFSIYYGIGKQFEIKINDISIQPGLKGLKLLENGNEFEFVLCIINQFWECLSSVTKEAISSTLTTALHGIVELDTICTIVKLLVVLL